MGRPHPGRAFHTFERLSAVPAQSGALASDEQGITEPDIYLGTNARNGPTFRARHPRRPGWRRAVLCPFGPGCSCVCQPVCRAFLLGVHCKCLLKSGCVHTDGLIGAGRALHSYRETCSQLGGIATRDQRRGRYSLVTGWPSQGGENSEGRRLKTSKEGRRPSSELPKNAGALVSALCLCSDSHFGIRFSFSLRPSDFFLRTGNFRLQKTQRGSINSAA